MPRNMLDIDQPRKYRADTAKITPPDCVLIVVIVLPVVIMPTESAVAPVSCPSLPESDALARDAQHYAKDLVWTLKRRSAD